MTHIKPFQALVYNQDKIRDLALVVSPPYDIISSARQQYYHELSPYNLTHIDLSRDTPHKDKYERAGGLFSEWIQQKVFVQDTAPAIYFYSQQFAVRGERKIRIGFFALLRLPEQESTVYAHEHTRVAPKVDRLNLIRRVHANISPIFVVIPDHKRIIPRLYQKYAPAQAPFIDITDEEKIVHKLWRIDNPEVTGEITSQLQGENIFIADGHHRYEVSCMYRTEIRQKAGVFTGEEGYNYIMAYFTSAESRDLTIFAIHRLVSLPQAFAFDSFKARLIEYFDLEEIKEKTKFLFLMEKAGSIEHVLGMYYAKKYWLLRLKNVKILDKLIADKPPQYRSLDVSILNYVVLHTILGMGLDDTGLVEYMHDTAELLQQADSDSGRMAFLLNPVKMQQIMAVALKGERMPPKSTFFYPKVPSGLVIHKF